MSKYGEPDGLQLLLGIEGLPGQDTTWSWAGDKRQPLPLAGRG
jgi:hypothetical protein